MAFTLSSIHVQPANALVKGNAPPPTKKAPALEERKCRNVEECQEMAEKAAAQADLEERANMLPVSVTSQGTKYRDLAGVQNGSPVAKVGDVATIYYKVLKLGKRSFDGLSGEGTVVFSRGKYGYYFLFFCKIGIIRFLFSLTFAMSILKMSIPGYGLEDDEEKPGVKTFSFTIGDSQIISALNDAIVGQAVGSVRRIAIMPQMGWEKATRECDGGPGGSGAGGDLKTDYVVVPTATMVATEVCFDKNKLPFPSSYAEQRRMAQRFDQSLIMEVELVCLN
jgi:FKBP-type peptidyl-prolyl cis-trans isomerase